MHARYLMDCDAQQNQKLRWRFLMVFSSNNTVKASNVFRVALNLDNVEFF